VSTSQSFSLVCKCARQWTDRQGGREEGREGGREGGHDVRLVEDTTDIAGLEKSIGHGEVEDDLREGGREGRRWGNGEMYGREG